MDRWRLPLPRPVDLLAAAALALVLQAELWSGLALVEPDPVLAAGYAVGAVAAAWHRAAPLPALVVALLGLAVVPGALGIDPAAVFAWFVIVLALLASVGYRARRPGLALAITLALFAVSIVLDKGFVLGDVAFAWVLATGAWLAGRALAGRTLRAELAEQRAALAEQRARWRAEEAVVEERLRIAREVHDVVSHGVSVMGLHVAGVRRLLRPEQERERAALETVEEVGRESLAELRKLLGVLHHGVDSAPGLARLPQLLEQARAAGLEVSSTVGGDTRDLPVELDAAAYRIVQQAVTNVLQHAGATRLECAVARREDAVELRIEDDGTADAADPADGFGLAGMRARAADFGGVVRAGPRPGGGWSVTAALPLAERAPSATPGDRP